MWFVAVLFACPFEFFFARRPGSVINHASCFHAHVHAGSTPDLSRDLAGDQRPAEKTEVDW